MQERLQSKEKADRLIKQFQQRQSASKKRKASGATVAAEAALVEAKRARPCEKPMSLVMYDLKKNKDVSLVYSSLVSRARHYFDYTVSTQWQPLLEEYCALQLQPGITLWPFQQEALRFVDERERDAAKLGCRGLILYIEMGLGKTVISLMRMLWDNQRCARQTGRRFHGTTLVLCPNAAVADNWLLEAQSKWPDGAFLSWRLYSSGNQHVERLYLEHFCDFLVCTYATLTTVYKYVKNSQQTGLPVLNEEEEAEEWEEQEGAAEAGETTEEERRARRYQEKCYLYDVLFGIQYKRIIADESHLFVNRRTDVYDVVMQLRSDVRWCLTGTPIRNHWHDMLSSFNFIQLPHQLQQQQQEQSGPAMTERLEELMLLQEKVMLSVSKKKLLLQEQPASLLHELPIFIPVVKTIRILDFESPLEKLLYYQYACYAQERLCRGGAGGGDHIPVLLGQLRQLCINPQIVHNLVLPRGMLVAPNVLPDVDLTSECNKALLPPPAQEQQQPQPSVPHTLAQFAAQLHRKTLFLYREERLSVEQFPSDCNLVHHQRLDVAPQVLLDDKTDNEEALLWDPYDSAQQQAFDWTRDAQAYQDCLDELMLQKPPATPSTPLYDAIRRHLQGRVLPADFCCSKNRYIVHYLQHTAPPEDKVIIFSDPTAPLFQLKHDLWRLAGISCCLVTGKTNARQNRETLERFQTDKTVRVLLISLKLGSIGLNMPWANHIIFLHPWWNPHLMRQAEARLQRFGQHKTVYVVHLVMNRTIELYVMQRASNKQALATSLLDEQDADVAAASALDYVESGGDEKRNMAHLTAYYYRQQ